MEQAMQGTYVVTRARADASCFGRRQAPEGEELAEVRALTGFRTESRNSQSDEASSAGECEHGEFQQIFDRYARPVTAFLRDLLGDWTQAEELTQETFIRAYRARGSKRTDTRISTWLFGIAYNVAREAIRDRYRRQKARGLEEADWRDLKDERVSPAQSVIDKETKLAIQRALAQLSESQRIVFILKVVNQMRYQEITAITGAHIGKLKTDLHRARLEMRRLLQPYIRGCAPGLRGTS